MTGGRRIPVATGAQVGLNAPPPQPLLWTLGALNTQLDHQGQMITRLAYRHSNVMHPKMHPVTLPVGCFWQLPRMLVLPGDELFVIIPGWRWDASTPLGRAHHHVFDALCGVTESGCIDLIGVLPFPAFTHLLADPDGKAGCWSVGSHAAHAHFRYGHLRLD